MAPPQEFKKSLSYTLIGLILYITSIFYNLDFVLQYRKRTWRDDRRKKFCKLPEAQISEPTSAFVKSWNVFLKLFLYYYIFKCLLIIEMELMKFSPSWLKGSCWFLEAELLGELLGNPVEGSGETIFFLSSIILGLWLGPLEIAHEHNKLSPLEFGHYVLFIDPANTLEFNFIRRAQNYSLEEFHRFSLDLDQFNRILYKLKSSIPALRPEIYQHRFRRTYLTIISSVSWLSLISMPLPALFIFVRQSYLATLQMRCRKLGLTAFDCNINAFSFSQMLFGFETLWAIMIVGWFLTCQLSLALGSVLSQAFAIRRVKDELDSCLRRLDSYNLTAPTLFRLAQDQSKDSNDLYNLNEKLTKMLIRLIAFDRVSEDISLFTSHCFNSYFTTLGFALASGLIARTFNQAAGGNELKFVIETMMLWFWFNINLAIFSLAYWRVKQDELTRKFNTFIARLYLSTYLQYRPLNSYLVALNLVRIANVRSTNEAITNVKYYAVTTLSFKSLIEVNLIFVSLAKILKNLVV